MTTALPRPPFMLPPGLGGLPRRPQNAPGAAPLVTGIQPGPSSPITLANKVIIFGANGGWFVYNGTPALGNPPVLYATSGTVDPYGNVLNRPFQIVSQSGAASAGLAEGTVILTDSLANVWAVTAFLDASSTPWLAFASPNNGATVAYMSPNGFMVPNTAPVPLSGTLTALQFVQDDRYNVQANEFDSAAAFTVAYTLGWPYGYRVTSSAINNAHPGSPGAYPSIYVGNQFGTLTQSNPLPIQVSALTPGEVTTIAVGTLGAAAGDIWDFSFDNWFNQSPVSVNNATNGLEHMVWMAQSDPSVQPAGSLYQANVNINGQIFDVWFHGPWANASQGTVTFLCQSQVTNLSYDMYYMTQYMIAQGWLPTNWYLINVQAGFELWKGGAGLQLDYFNVSNAPASHTGIPETWQIGALQNGWTAFAGRNLKYRANIDGMVKLRGQLTPGTTASGTLVWQAPTGYYSSLVDGPIPINCTQVSATGCAAYYMEFNPSSGQLLVQNGAAPNAGVAIRINAEYPVVA